MSVDVEVRAAGSVPSELTAIGLPVVVGESGPRLMDGLPPSVGDIVLPTDLNERAAVGLDLEARSDRR